MIHKFLINLKNINFIRLFLTLVVIFNCSKEIFISEQVNAFQNDNEFYCYIRGFKRVNMIKPTN